MKFIILVVFLLGTTLAEEETPKEVIPRTEKEHTLTDDAGVFSQTLAAAHDDTHPNPEHISDHEQEEVKRDQRQILTTATLHQPLLYINQAEEYYHPYNFYYNPLVRLNPTYYYQPLKTIHPSPYIVQTLAKK